LRSRDSLKSSFPEFSISHHPASRLHQITCKATVYSSSQIPIGRNPFHTFFCSSVSPSWTANPSLQFSSDYQLNYSRTDKKKLIKLCAFNCNGFLNRITSIHCRVIKTLKQNLNVDTNHWSLSRLSASFKPIPLSQMRFLMRKYDRSPNPIQSIVLRCQFAKHRFLQIRSRCQFARNFTSLYRGRSEYLNGLSMEIDQPTIDPDKVKRFKKIENSVARWRLNLNFGIDHFNN
jgi:hypothetical protein